jgi:hypothetical protein
MDGLRFSDYRYVLLNTREYGCDLEVCCRLGVAVIGYKYLTEGAQHKVQVN